MFACLQTAVFDADKFIKRGSWAVWRISWIACWSVGATINCGLWMQAIWKYAVNH